MSMMHVPAYLEESGEERRAEGRYRANLLAIMRRQKQPNEAIQIVDLSSEGCGFRSRRPVPVGARLWLALPGLETWPARVAWFRDGEGGLSFDRPLEPLAALRLASGEEDGDR
jgi:PilZ domain-containing protein